MIFSTIFDDLFYSALQHGGSISRCAENHVRDTQDFMELSKPKATRGFKNAKCPSDIRPSVNDKPIGKSMHI